METACNITHHVPLIVELVNIAVPVWRGGSVWRPPRDEQLLDAFCPLLPENTAATLRATPDAGRRLTELATALHDVLVGDTAEETARRINALIRRYGARPWLVEDHGQPFHLHFQGTGTGVDRLGAEYAAALALIVDGYGVDRFGRCAASQCDAVYIDMTRNGSRRFCGPGCGARANTAAYRDRRRGAPR